MFNRGNKIKLKPCIRAFKTAVPSSTYIVEQCYYSTANKEYLVEFIGESRTRTTFRAKRFELVSLPTKKELLG